MKTTTEVSYTITEKSLEDKFDKLIHELNGIKWCLYLISLVLSGLVGCLMAKHFH